MTNQIYLLWHIGNRAKARIGRETITLRWNPGREQQFIEMITRWEAQDGKLPPEPKEQPDAN